MLYILIALSLTVISADISGMYGRDARELDLPFGVLAEFIVIAVPILCFIVAIPSIRKRLGLWHLLAYVLVLCCICLPVLIFKTQTTDIQLKNFPNTEAYKMIQDQFPRKVKIIRSNGETVAHVSNKVDPEEVARLIFKYDPTIKMPNKIE